LSSLGNLKELGKRRTNRLARWDNPIFRREMIRLERRTVAHRWRSAAIILSLISILGMLFALLLWMYPSPYGQSYIWMFFPAWSTWVIYAITVLQAIVASTSILGEFTQQTWEQLIVTGISVRRILFGNWLAALHRIRGWLFFLIIARIAVLPIYLLVSVKVALPVCSYAICVLQPPAPLSIWFVAIGITVVLTILDILCCSLIGLAASAITGNSRFAAVFAILVRFSPLVVFLAFGFNDLNFWEWWASPPFALVDGGTAPAVQLIMPLSLSDVHFEPFLGLLLITSALTLIFLAMLSATLVILRINGASAQPVRLRKSKSHRLFTQG
jgi:hypothetical protein